MSEPNKKRRIYWLTPGNSAVVGERALALAAKGYNVQLFSSLELLTAELANKRANILLVSDDTHSDIVESMLTRLMSMPEVQGARLILASTQPAERPYQLAACSNFRDIIPLDLDEKTFLMRVLFATGGRPSKFTYPSGQISLKNISAANFPARIVWISPTQLRLECRLKPAPGSALTILGELPRQLGVEQLTTHVIETQRSHLHYRFSEAIIVEWQLPNAVRERAQAALKQLQGQNTGPRTRVFVAVQSSDLRINTLLRFSDPRFEVVTAIHRQSIIDDPKFFTPDIVFFEDQLIAEDGGERFRQMLTNIASTATIFVVGNLPSGQNWHEDFAQHRIVELPRDAQVVASNILARHLPLYDAQKPEGLADTIHFAAENPLSIADVQVPARLTRIHPSVLQIALPAPVSQFALARIDSPLIHKTVNRSPYIKITECYPDAHPDAAPFSHLADGYICDFFLNERQFLSTQLIRLINDNYKQLDLGGNFIDGHSHSATARMPELGSLKPQDPNNKAKILNFPQFSPISIHTNTGQAAVQPNVDHSLTQAQPAVATLVLSPTAVSTWSDDKISANSGQANLPADAITPQLAISMPRDALSPPQGLAERDFSEKKRARLAALAAKRRRQMLKDIRAVLLFVAVLIGGLAAIWLVGTYIAPGWQRSGGIYSEQLQRFAPGWQRQETQQP